MTSVLVHFRVELLLLDLLLLAGVVAFTLRLVQRARISGHLLHPETFPTQEPLVEEHCNAARAPALPLPVIPITTADTLSPPPAAEIIQFSDLVADPIDGTPFTPGQQIMLCRCGTGYQLDTWEWILQHHEGHCVHCGAKAAAEIQRVPDHAQHQHPEPRHGSSFLS